MGRQRQQQNKTKQSKAVAICAMFMCDEGAFRPSNIYVLLVWLHYFY